MFKYISEILQQFSPTQKMLALIILLIAFVSVTYITQITKTPEELTKTITLQRQRMVEDQNKIFDLSRTIIKLNDTILINNQNCSDNALTREKYYVDKLITQQKYVTATIEEIQKLLDNKPRRLEMIRLDSSVSVKRLEIPDEQDVNIELINKKLKQLKNKLKE